MKKPSLEFFSRRTSRDLIPEVARTMAPLPRDRHDHDLTLYLRLIDKGMSLEPRFEEIAF